MLNVGILYFFLLCGLRLEKITHIFRRCYDIYHWHDQEYRKFFNFILN